MSSKLDVLSISVFMCLFIHAEPPDKSMYIKCKWGEISRFSEDRINLLSGSHNKHIQNLSWVTFKIWWNLLVEFSSTPWGVIMNRDMLFQCRLQFLSYSPICIARVSRFRKSHEESMHVYLLSLISKSWISKYWLCYFEKRGNYWNKIPSKSDTCPKVFQTSLIGK